MALVKPSSPVFNPNHPLSKGLVGAWLAADARGANATIRDMVAKNNGAGSANLQIGIGPRGLFYLFDNAQIVVPHRPELVPAQISIAAGIYTTTVALYRNFISKGDNSGYRVRVNQTAGTIRFFDRGATNNLDSTSALALNTWADVVCTGDTSGLKIYWNGKLDSSNATPYGGPTVTNTLLIGNDAALGDSPWSGGIEYLYIYNRALNPYEALQLYIDPYRAFRPVPTRIGLSIAAPTTTTVALTWTDNSVGETGYSIERSTDGINYSEIGTAAADATSYNDETAALATTYYYRVKATGSPADSDYSNVATITTA